MNFWKYPYQEPMLAMTMNINNVVANPAHDNYYKPISNEENSDNEQNEDHNSINTNNTNLVEDHDECYTIINTPANNDNDILIPGAGRFQSDNLPWNYGMLW